MMLLWSLTLIWIESVSGVLPMELKPIRLIDSSLNLQTLTEAANRYQFGHRNEEFCGRTRDAAARKTCRSITWAGLIPDEIAQLEVEDILAAWLQFAADAIDSVAGTTCFN